MSDETDRSEAEEILAGMILVDRDELAELRSLKRLVEISGCANCCNRRGEICACRMCSCYNCGHSLGASDVIGIEIQGVYDGVLVWKCTCGAMTHRFSGETVNDTDKVDRNGVVR
jgi:hypothetical protein